jgi:hypothetical protein
MAKIPVTPEVEQNAGQIGDVVHSILDEATFQALRGANWVLMDGSDITGSALADIIGTTLPDARGQFLRGKNNGRADGQEDPAGERALGDQQTDNMQGHNHDYFASTGTSTIGGQHIGTVSGSTRGAHATGSPPGGDILGPTDDTLGNGVPRKGPETRPKNLAVNIYIRID